MGSESTLASWAAAMTVGLGVAAGLARTSQTAPSPTTGVAPITQTMSLLAFATVIGVLPAGSSLASPSLPALAILLALSLVYGVLFHRPKLRAALLQRATGVEPTEARRRAVHETKRGTMTSLGVLGVLVAVDALLIQVAAQPTLTVLSGLLAGAALLDVVAELRARRVRLVSVWPLHRPYALDLATSTLTLRGIPVFVRNRHLRPLMQFFGPYTPMELLVPVHREDEARELMQALLGDAEPQSP